MNEELKPHPCPFCGNKDLSVNSAGKGYYVECNACASAGPFIANQKEAIKQWKMYNERT